MTLRERIADWLTGGALTRAERESAIRSAQAHEQFGKAFVLQADLNEARAEAANIAAQRDEAIARGVDYSWQVKARNDALRAILTARNITEARKIARDALGKDADATP